MKFSLIHNDKSTYKDEALLGIFVIVWLVCGAWLIAYRPQFLFFNASRTACLGVLLVLVAVMFIPCLIYRLVTNDKK